MNTLAVPPGTHIRQGKERQSRLNTEMSLTSMYKLTFLKENFSKNDIQWDKRGGEK